MFACADALNLSRIEMIGMLVSLWLWALDNAHDGSLEGVSDRTIARVCDFPEKKASKLMESLHKYGWLDRIGDHYAIHDWYDYAGKLMERREKDRRRKKNSTGKQDEFHRNSDGTPEDVPGNSYATVPNRTLPYPTVPNISGGDGVTARGRAASDDELFGIGIMPGDFFGVSAETVAETRKTTDALFSRYLTGTTPKPWDYRQVFKYCGGSGRACLLDYAFEKAAVSGKPGDWRYVHGIMDRLFARDIRTEAQAREWDESRPDLE